MCLSGEAENYNGRGMVRGDNLKKGLGCRKAKVVIVNYSTAKAEQTYFAIRGGKAKRVDAASVVEAASVCGGKSHFAAKLRICPPRHAAVRDMMPRHIDSNNDAVQGGMQATE
ncbi:hypothetical protein DPMN_006247 [Dreissena polymorpha]|uniref:Uncharacterized protein n=1 Tax=Dreissena polymorpha TaxID=45954 RepID=A0A9D4MW55_DREPO|nr:hypothetical protein DPMN_006247 [Dreissena polymorpha]